jgi:hypothetical protein
MGREHRIGIQAVPGDREQEGDQVEPGCAEQRPVAVADLHPATAAYQDVVVPQIEMGYGGAGTACHRLASQRGNLVQPPAGTLAFDHLGHPGLDLGEFFSEKGPSADRMANNRQATALTRR